MAPHIRSHRSPSSCFPKTASLQLSSEQSVGDVWITQLIWKRFPSTGEVPRLQEFWNSKVGHSLVMDEKSRSDNNGVMTTRGVDY